MQDRVPAVYRPGFSPQAGGDFLLPVREGKQAPDEQ